MKFKISDEEQDRLVSKITKQSVDYCQEAIDRWEAKEMLSAIEYSDLQECIRNRDALVRVYNYFTAPNEREDIWGALNPLEVKIHLLRIPLDIAAEALEEAYSTTNCEYIDDLVAKIEELLEGYE